MLDVPSAVATCKDAVVPGTTWYSSPDEPLGVGTWKVIRSLLQCRTVNVGMVAPLLLPIGSGHNYTALYLSTMAIGPIGILAVDAAAHPAPPQRFAANRPQCAGYRRYMGAGS
jgi:hypothetical protein